MGIQRSSSDAVLTSLAFRIGSIYAAKEEGSKKREKALTVSVFHFFKVLVNKLLFADAEVGEDVVKDGVTGDLTACDFAEGADGEAKVGG